MLHHWFSNDSLGLQWELGNYPQSFLIMLGLQVGSAIDASTLSSCHVAFMDPSVGLYCLTLANNTSMRNAVGDQNAGVLARWASLMSATSLNRCGLPVSLFCCMFFFVGISKMTIPNEK